jgi:hypothetical protein
MAGISSLLGSTTLSLDPTSTTQSTKVHGHKHCQGGMSTRLDDLLTDSGLDDDQQAALKTDLKSAIKSVLDSGTTPPSPDAMKSAMAGVFDKYGLDGQSLVTEMAPSGAGASSTQPSSDLLAALTDSSSSASKSGDMLAQLIQALQQSNDSSSSSNDKNSSQLSDQLLQALSGINGYA